MTSSISGFGGGMPSASQISQMRERMFQKADANADGSVDKAEFGKMRPPGMGGAGMPSSDEMFAKIDGDGNGALSKDEMKAFGDKMSSQMKSMLLGAQEGAGEEENESPLDALFKALDQDEDGSVSKSEFQEFGKRARENGARQGNDAYADALNLLPTSLASLLGNGEDNSRRTQDELIGLLMKA